MLSGLTNYLPETALTVFDNLEFFIRIVLAAILGALVGLERSKRQKEAGVRTGRTTSGPRAWARGVSTSARVRSGARISALRPREAACSNTARAHVERPDDGAPRAITSPKRAASTTARWRAFSSGRRHQSAPRLRNLT